MQIITFEGSWTMKPKELWKQMSTRLSNQRMSWRTFWPSLKSWTPSEKRKKRLKSKLGLQMTKRSSRQSSRSNNSSNLRGKEKRTKRNNLSLCWPDHNCTYNVQNDGIWVYLNKCFPFWWDNFKVVLLFLSYFILLKKPYCVLINVKLWCFALV